MAAQAANHADFIKLWMDDHLGDKKKMPYEIAQAIIESAHRHHLRVVAHVFYLQDAKQLVAFGVDGLAHSVRDKARRPGIDRRDEKARNVADGGYTFSRRFHVRVWADASFCKGSVFHPQRFSRSGRDPEKPGLPGKDTLRSLL